PYHKGLVRPALEKRVTFRPVAEGRITPRLRQAIDRFEGEQLRITRADRDRILREHHKLTKQAGPGHEAMTSFGQWLADPNAIDPGTGKPFYRAQLQDAIDHYSHRPPSELPDEKVVRETVVGHLKNLQHLSHADMQRAYKASLTQAEKKRALEPELEKHR